MKTFILPVGFAFILGGVLRAADPVDFTAQNSAQIFINTREAEWFNFKSDDIKESYPFGNSDKANNDKLSKLLDMSKVSTNSDLTNKHYIAEGDWYAVEWFYHATNVPTGNRQVEASLCLAQIKDQKMVRWIEYFDDTVGEQQIAGKLTLYAENEMPFPWPAQAQVKRVYRP